MEKIKNLSLLKKILLAVVTVVVALIILVAFSDESNVDLTDLENRVNEEISAQELVRDPGQYRNEVVYLTGRVFNTESDGDRHFLQVWTDVDQSEGNVAIYYDGDDLDVFSDDYIEVYGVVTGTTSGENLVGGTVTAPRVQAGIINNVGRDQVAAPALKTVETEETQEKGGISISLNSIEFAENETRLNVTIANNSGSEISFYGFNTKIVQDGSQVQEKSVFDSDSRSIPSDIVANTTESGVLHFEEANPESPLTITFEASRSDDYESFEFVFEVN
ncbi:MAG: hypothetical protein WD061_00155 [Candidatus Saccharimonadales bacterium]